MTLTYNINRRDFLGAVAAVAFSMGVNAADSSASEAIGLRFGRPQPFSWELLVQKARKIAAIPYVAPPTPSPDIVKQMKYDMHRNMVFRPELALFGDRVGMYKTSFFPLGEYFAKTIQMHVVENNQARHILYDPSYFNVFNNASVPKLLPEDAGFAGFFVHSSEVNSNNRDWLSYLGASYFRTSGDLGEYGISARGIAIDTADEPEEFPDFTEYYLHPSSYDNKYPMIIHALLDGPSVAGAFQFIIHRENGVRMDVENVLFMRKSVKRLGIAPMSSMYWFDDSSKHYQIDWRNAVHDSDGLAIRNGYGECIWRPLINPPRVAVSAFVDHSPLGFGLIQRSRDPNRYLPQGVRYDMRPNLWVEPIGAWGPGSVQLIEIPTVNEYLDNMACMWVPEAKISGGEVLEFRYRLHWNSLDPLQNPSLSKVISTKIGKLRIDEDWGSGTPVPRHIVVEFGGADLLANAPEISITSSRGNISGAYIEPASWDPQRYLVHFTLDASGKDPVDLKLVLMQDGKPVSESWFYQVYPENNVCA